MDYHRVGVIGARFMGTNSSSYWAYLLVIRASGYDIVHERGQQFSNTLMTGGICAIQGVLIRPDGLASLSGLLYPGSCYGVYDIKDT